MTLAAGKPDALACSNPNSLAGAFLADCLAAWGLKQAVISPGSRSTPLTVALARHPRVETIPIVDERSAGFFALGLAKRTDRPVLLVCTSGTAGVHYHAALVEARYRHVPLIAITADRPPELQECHSGQTIRQQDLFGWYPVFHDALAIPEARPATFQVWLQTLRRAWTESQAPDGGPVHLNAPFRDPLVPTPEAGQALQPARLWPAGWADLPPVPAAAPYPASAGDEAGDRSFLETDRGLIVVGTVEPADPEPLAEAANWLSAVTGWPVLADALAPLRSREDPDDPWVITYDALLRSSGTADRLRPDAVLQVGSLPTSKGLRQWLEGLGTDVTTRVIDPTADNRDPLGRNAPHRAVSLEAFAGYWAPRLASKDPSTADQYREQWLSADRAARTVAADAFGQEGDALWEAALPVILGEHLPDQAQVVIASSMPVRDCEVFWPGNRKRLRVASMRGANGIDGTLSHAFGLARQSPAPTYLLTGDLAFLHDSNGLLQAKDFRGSLTVLLINNHGGGIFENLPIAEFDPPFEACFATPQTVDFGKLCAAHGIPHTCPAGKRALISLLQTPPDRGVRVLEVVTDRKADPPRRRARLQAMAAAGEGKASLG